MQVLRFALWQSPHPSVFRFCSAFLPGCVSVLFVISREGQIHDGAFGSKAVQPAGLTDLDPSSAVCAEKPDALASVDPGDKTFCLHTSPVANRPVGYLTCGHVLRNSCVPDVIMTVLRDKASDLRYHNHSSPAYSFRSASSGSPGSCFLRQTHCTGMPCLSVISLFPGLQGRESL